MLPWGWKGVYEILLFMKMFNLFYKDKYKCDKYKYLKENTPATEI